MSNKPRPPPLSPHQIKTKQGRYQQHMLKCVLGGMDLGEYLQILTRHRIDYLDFLRLSKDDLYNMGIKNPEHCQQLYDYIEKFAKEPAQYHSPANAVMQPLCTQERDTLSQTEKIQMLDNINVHLLHLAGHHENSNEDVTLGIANLRKQIEKNSSGLESEISIGTMIAVADSTLEALNLLQEEFMKYQLDISKLKM